MFDTVDKLYKTKSGSTESAPPPPEGGGMDLGGLGGPPPPSGPPPGPELGGDAGGLPENKEKNNLNILLESDDIHGDSYIDLSRAKNSLGSIENELSKLLRD